MMSNNTAYLVGFMGSGKSSILQLIQEKTEFNTIDLDDIVEAENSESIENMFKKFGLHKQIYKFKSTEVFSKTCLMALALSRHSSYSFSGSASAVRALPT